MVKAEKKTAAALIANDALIISSSSSSSSSSEYKKKYKGVRMRSWGSWVSEIRAPNQKTRIWLGSHSTPEAAARAYDAALFCLKGSSANFNFPFSIRNYSDNTSSIMSPKSIQRVAAAAANTNTNYNTSNNPTNFLDENLNILSSQSASASASVSASSLNGSDSSSSLSSSSPTNHPETTLHSIEDDLISLGATTPFDGGDDYSWYNFESPKYYTEMVNGVFFDPHMIMEDSYEDADIRLWSFC